MDEPYATAPYATAPGATAPGANAAQRWTATLEHSALGG
jgi:hypothetical protein